METRFVKRKKEWRIRAKCKCGVRKEKMRAQRNGKMRGVGWKKNYLREQMNKGKEKSPFNYSSNAYSI